jgi:polar amino acid transport system permease protein
VVLLILGRKAAGKREAMALSSAHVPFSIKLGIVWVSIFFLLAVMFALMQFDVGWMQSKFRFVAWGLLYTILLALFAIVLAVLLALLGALGRLSSNPVAYGISGFYTSFFRGTPLIVQLFIIYLALPQIGANFGRLSVLNILTLTSFQAGVLGLGLNYGAYMTEIFRAGIQSVSHGQSEAADALGMTYGQRMRRVVLPQALRVIIPPTGNEFIAMMKDTALVSVLGSELETAELFRRAKVVGPPDHKSLEALILAASLYWGLTAVFSFFQKRVEIRLSRGYVRTEVRQVTGRKPFRFISGPAGGIGGGGGGVVIEDEGDGTQTEGMP